mmetsp:Transcript_5220/g.10580  ORF Transcript_5220/g.10580 Transcript_5220/m.10580 type:complete len:188 (+) Transcript_5220:103-666(+)
MGLLSILKKVKAKEREVRLLILGLDNAGKTTILKKINNEPTHEIEPTLGFNIKTLLHRGFTLNIWDIGGQQTIRSYWRNYFEKTDGIVFVIDASDRDRLMDCKMEMLKLLRAEKLAGASLIIFANKQDIPFALPSSKIAESLGLATDPAFKTRHWAIFGCSTVTGEGLLEGITWIVDDISSRIFMLT